ncbi:hypothetical protein ACJMK2_000858, partial [Sinanodonta woodiana]
MDGYAAKAYGLVTLSQVPIPLSKVMINVTVKGFICSVESTLLYINSETSPVESIFVFPCGEYSCTVYKFQANIDGRNIVAQCVDKDELKESNKDKTTPFFLPGNGQEEDVFRCRLGQLPPQSQIRLVLTYSQELSCDKDGQLTFTLPSILNPRYSPEYKLSCDSEMLKSDHFVAYNRTAYEVDFTLLINGNVRIKNVDSPKEKIYVEYTSGKQVALVSLAEDFTFKFDHDISVVIQYEESYLPHAILERGSPNKNGFLQQDILMINYFPELLPSPEFECGEFIFLINTSGSMDVTRIEEAKSAMLLLLEILPKKCYFNVISFADTYAVLFDDERVEYSEDKHLLGMKFIQQITAVSGETNLEKPLQFVYSTGVMDGVNKQVFLITTAEVWDISENLFSQIRQQSDYARLFVVHIGEKDAQSSEILTSLVQAGKGKEVFWSRSDNMDDKIKSLMRSALHFDLRNLKLTWDLPPTVKPVVVPNKKPAAIFAGERLIIYILLIGLNGQPTTYNCSVTLHGSMEDVDIEKKMEFSLCKMAHEEYESPIHCMAGKTTIRQLEMDKYNEDPETRSRIIFLSTSANLTSKYTVLAPVDHEGKVLNNLLISSQSGTPSHIDGATIPIHFGLSNHMFQTSKRKHVTNSDRNCGLPKSPKSSKGLNFSKLASFFKPKSKHLESSSNDVNLNNSEIEAIQMEFSSNCDVLPKKDTLHAKKKLLTRQRQISSGDEEERTHQNSELGNSTNGSSDGNEFSEVSQKIEQLKTGDAELDKILQLQHDDGYWNLTEDIAAATFNLPIREIKSRLGLQ